LCLKMERLLVFMSMIMIMVGLCHATNQITNQKLPFHPCLNDSAGIRITSLTIDRFPALTGHQSMLELEVTLNQAFKQDTKVYTDLHINDKFFRASHHIVAAGAKQTKWKVPIFIPFIWKTAQDLHFQFQLGLSDEMDPLLSCFNFLLPITPTPTQNDAPLVNVVLYMESLCPDCRYYITELLFPAYSLGLSNIMNLTLVPYGNAHEVQVGNQWQFTCQHGVQECQGNIYETCAVKMYPDVHLHFQFIDCVESSLDPIQGLLNCAQYYGLDPDALATCAGNAQGNEWEHEMAVMTDILVPPHDYVPWVTINGVHSPEAETDAVTAICNTYTGSAKPKLCNQKTFIKRELKGCFHTST